MPGPFIRLGDTTSHGGRVVEASGFSDSLGIGIARIGDKVCCPIPGHGCPPIVTGDATLIVDGKPVARQGDMTGCGAMLIASQQPSNDLI